MKKNRETIRARPNNFFLFFSVTILLAFLTAGCGGTDQPEVEEVEPTATTAVISFTPTPDLVSPTPPTPLPTATPETPVEPVVRGSQVITTDNVDQIEFLDRIGRGTAVEAYYLEGGDRYVIVSKAGFDTYSSDGELLSHIPVMDANYELSPDGRYVAMRTGTKHQVILYDLYANEIKQVFQHEETGPPFRTRPLVVWIWGETWGMKFNHQNNKLAIGYGDFSIGIWDIETGEEHLLNVGPLITPKKMAFSQDNQYLIVMEPNATAAIYIWDISNQEIYGSVQGVGTFGDNPFSMDSSKVVIYYNSGYSVYSLPTGTHLFKSGIGQYQARVEYSQDGEYLIAPEYEVVMDSETGTKLPDVAYVSFVSREPVESSEEFLLLQGYDMYRGISVVGQELMPFDSFWGENAEGVFLSVSDEDGTVKYRPDEDMLGNIAVMYEIPAAVYCNGTGQLIRWVYAADEKTVLEDDCNSPGLVSTSGNGEVVVYTDTNSTVRVVTNGEETRLGGGKTAINGVFMDETGDLIGVSYDAPVSTGPTSGELFLFFRTEVGFEKINYPITGEVMGLTLSLENNLVAATDPISEGGEPMFDPYTPTYGKDDIYPGSVRIWDTRGGSLLIIKAQGQGITFSKSGNLLFVGSPRGGILVYSTTTGELVKELRGYHGLGIIQLHMSVDGMTLYALSEDGSISKWGVSSE